MSRHFRHRHLRRLNRIWIDEPIYFITATAADRGSWLSSESAEGILKTVWENAQRLYRWTIGSYVIMPDHVHFFCAPKIDSKPLEVFVGKWKEWTSKYLKSRLGYPTPFWQEGFFDHVLRSDESYLEKWRYVRANPVRAGLVGSPDEWPFWGCMNPI